MNVCSYHLQEAGATPEQELAFALATATRRARPGPRPGRPRRTSPSSSRRISFFVNAGIRFVTEMCKMRAFVDLWDEIAATATASPTRSSAASATACRSTRSA